MDEAQTNRLIERVHTLLQQTDPYKWEMADVALTTEIKVPKLLDTWERVYALETPEGTLVLRSSQPVRGNYVAGGYCLVATAPEDYIIEMRAKGWRAVEITEPWKGYAIADKRYQRLLDGDVAKELFMLVRDRIRNYEQEEKKSFDVKAQDFLQKLPSLVKRMRGEDWEREEPTVAERRYSAEFGDIKVRVIRKSQLGSYLYSISAEKGPLKIDGKNPEVAKQIFFEIERLHQVSGLLTLGKALESAHEKRDSDKK